MRLRAALDEFVLALRDEHLRSPHTVCSYRRTVEAFVAVIGDLSVSRVRRDHVRTFLVKMRDERGNSPSTLKAKVAALRAFFGLLIQRGHRRTLPLDAGDFRIRAPRKIVTVLSQEDLDRLLAAVEDGTTTAKRDPRGRAKGLDPKLRDRALLFLLAGCGLRVAELVALELASIDVRRKVIRVRGKGGFEREVFYDLEPIERHVEDYLRARRALGLLDGSLFINFRDGRRMTTRAVQLLIKAYGRAAQLDEDVTPHVLRHTYASLSIERGANVKAISQILGHASVQTTINTYTHLSEKHVRDVFRLCHPLQEQRIPLSDRVERRKKSLEVMTS